MMKLLIFYKLEANSDTNYCKDGTINAGVNHTKQCVIMLLIFIIFYVQICLKALFNKLCCNSIVYSQSAWNAHIVTVTIITLNTNP